MKYGPAQFGEVTILFDTYSKSQLGLGVAVGCVVGEAAGLVGVAVGGALVALGAPGVDVGPDTLGVAVGTEGAVVCVGVA